MSEPKQSATYWGSPITIEHMHGSLKANLHFPPDFDGAATTKTYPAVLLLHGLGGNREEHNGIFIRTAATFALAGFIALRVDFRGAGETGGDTQDMTIESEVQDAADCIKHLLALPFVRREQLAILGLSFGGLAGAILAARRKDIAALVLWEAPYDMIATMKRLYGHVSVRSVRARGYLQAGMLKLSPAFFDTLEALDVDSTIAGYAGPVLIVQGVEDAVVPVDTAYHWRRGFTSTVTDVHLIQEADHAFTHEKWAWEAINHTLQWLQDKLGITNSQS